MLTMTVPYIHTAMHFHYKSSYTNKTVIKKKIKLKTKF